jgi:3-oxoacyl-[acyl-carrier protein] reductase
VELGPNNIRVNCVAPNFVNAPERFERWQKLMAEENVPTPEALQHKWAARVALPNRRWGTVEEVANTIAFAASPAAGYTTGEVFVIDGGHDRG